MTAGKVARALGAAQRSGRWWRCLCPVHGSRTGRSASLALRDGEGGLIVHCHAGCEPRDVLAELRCRGLIGGSDDRRPLAVRPYCESGNDGDDRSRRIAVAARIWEAASGALGSPVAQYLVCRGITISPPTSIRWTRSLRIGRGLPASRPGGGGVSRRADGSCGPAMGPAHRRLRRRADRGAIKVSAAGASRTAPPAVRPSDVSGAGERAARKAAHRWLAEGRRVRIAMPPEPGSDFNSVLLRGGRTCMPEPRDGDA